VDFKPLLFPTNDLIPLIPQALLYKTALDLIRIVRFHGAAYQASRTAAGCSGG
jgi:hypothetical protein